MTLVSIIVPIHNGAPWINRCFDSILEQTVLNLIKLEVCVCNDASTDDTASLLNIWQFKFGAANIPLKIYNNPSNEPHGVGYAKNRAISISSGTFLCFQDIDDIMLPNRIEKQFKKACDVPDTTLIGSNYQRFPVGSTIRYTKWANGLDEKQLNTQVYTAFGPTIIMPTWFCHKNLYDRVGGFTETKTGCPEDLIFFYRHLDLKGKVCKVHEILLIYTYHLQATTFSVNEETIWNIRLERLQRVVLCHWSHFTIWNAGRQGRKLYNSLSETQRQKVIALCDVDQNKIGKRYEPYNPTTRKSGRPVKIINYKEAKPPFVICVKIDLTNGIFEDILKNLDLTEGTDYVWFS